MNIPTDSDLLILIYLIAYQRIVCCEIVLALLYYLKSISLMQ